MLTFGRRNILDILYLVDRLENLINDSKRMPLVNSLMIKETDILNIVDQMRTSIPDEVKQARRIIQDKERILAQAQTDASSLLAKAREESERAIQREGLLRAAEARSQEIVRQAEKQSQDLIAQTEEHCEHLKVDADAYVAETLRNIKDHLASIEMDVSRTIISIDKGLESLEMQAAHDEAEEGLYGEEEQELHAEYNNAAVPSRSVPRRASLANDTTGGPRH
jgi:hypothetical protein